MSKNWVKLVAAILYVCSLATWMYGRSLESMETIMEEPPHVWTAWDYISCVLLVTALGCTLAAIKIKDEDDEDI